MAQAWMNVDDNKFKDNLYRSIQIEERRAEPYFLMAQFYESKSQYVRAIQWYEFAAAIQRPADLLATYQPSYYTWLPCLQLVVSYNAIGNLEKALEWCERGLVYRPEDTRFINNKRLLLLAIQERKDRNRKDGQGKRLNLGCGCKREEGYINADIFKGPTVDEVFDLDDIPYLDGTISVVSSEHSLEHVGWARADKALQEWWRVLRPGGQLMLKIPDFEECCRKYLETPHENARYRQWYKYTVYGAQKSLAGESEDAQCHRAGWSKREMCEKLEALGFIIDYSENYDGWDTPSCSTLAVKPVSDLKIGWIAPTSMEPAQTRIRVLHINRWLRARGYKSAVVNYTDIINQNYDVCIVGKGFDEHHFRNIRMLKQYGKTVICDLCESIIDFPWVREILQICDKVICCSLTLAEIVRPINSNVEVIEDAYEA